MINIIYRPCGYETQGSKRNDPNHRPHWFTKENTFKSLVISILNAKQHINKFTVVYDGWTGTFFEYIKETCSILSKENIQCEIINTNFNSVYGSLNFATQLGCNQGGDTYFVEDDYFHLPNAIMKMVLALPKHQLLSGYDHLDRYTRTDDIDYKIQVSFDFPSNTHWRTVESTGHSYALTGELLSQISDIIQRHEFIASDRELWRYLHSVNIPIWVPIPGLVTQVDPFLSPGVDWEQQNEIVKNYIIG